MQQFTDSQGNTWTLHLTWGKAEEIQQRCRRPSWTPENNQTFDFFNILDQEQIADMMISDPATGRFCLDNAKALLNVLYVLCEEQCHERGISDVAFGALMMDSSFRAAMKALMEETGNFIQNPEQKKLFQKLLALVDEKQSFVSAEMSRILEAKLTAMDAHITRTLETQVEAAWKAGLPDIPAVAASGTTNYLNVAR